MQFLSLKMQAGIAFSVDIIRRNELESGDIPMSFLPRWAIDCKPFGGIGSVLKLSQRGTSPTVREGSVQFGPALSRTVGSRSTQVVISMFYSEAALEVAERSH
jgi:hypothetical protein